MPSAVSLSTIVLRGEWLTNKLSLVRMIKLILQVLKWAVFASALRENIVRTLVDGAEKAHINEHQIITKKRTIFDRVICFVFSYMLLLLENQPIKVLINNTHVSPVAQSCR